MKSLEQFPCHVTLQYKCRRCGARYFDPSINYIENVKTFKELYNKPNILITTHDCNDNYDGSRYGIADLIGCKVERK